MELERIELSAKERERLKVLQQVEEGRLKQIEAARRLDVSDRQVRRWQARLRSEGDRGIVHRLRGRCSNRQIPEGRRRGVLRQLRKACDAGFGPTLAAEDLARHGMPVSRETLRKWMSAAGLWRPRNRRLKTVHVWRPRRSAFGELVMMDSSPYGWLEDRGPACHLIALIDDASSRAWGRLVEHDSTEENLRTLQGWLQHYGRPLALYTDKNSLFVTSRPVQWQEQLRGEPARTQFGRALGGTGHRVGGRAFTAGQRTDRAAVRGAAGSFGERDAPAADRHTRTGQPFSGEDLLALLAAALRRAAGPGRECPPAPGGQPSAGGNSQRAGGAHGGGRSHRELARAALGSLALNRSAPDYEALEWRSKDAWMAVTGCASAAVTCRCIPARRRHGGDHYLPPLPL